jgi:hypothetical protein
VEREALKEHAKQAVAALTALGSEAAVAVVAEVALGQRAEALDSGKELRDAAASALASRGAPLPRRAALVLASFLRQQADKRIKLLVGGIGLGVDVPACRAAVRLLAGSEEPEAKEALELPFVKKLASRGTAELLKALSPEE